MPYAPQSTVSSPAPDPLNADVDVDAGPGADAAAATAACALRPTALMSNSTSSNLLSVHLSASALRRSEPLHHHQARQST